MIKMIFLGLLLGGTLGVSLASEVVDRIGMSPETYLVGLGGLVFAALLVHRGTAMIIAVSALTMAVLQPEQALLEHGFDKDILMAALLVVVFYPIVYRLMHS